MFKSTKKGNSVLLPVLFWAAAALFILVPLFFGPVADAKGWNPVSGTRASAVPTPEAPVYTGYKGVTIGMPMDEARAKLGKPRDMSDVEDYYVYSETETCQVQYDMDKTVKIISVNYIGDNKSAPAPKVVFGADAEAKPDGSIFKLVRYPKSGVFISYNKIPGDNLMTVVTLQKIPGPRQ
jgi:hypothetical protein